MKRRRLIVALAVAAIVLGVARALLPVVAHRYVSANLADMGDYAGQVADVDIALLRGAYTLRGLSVVKTGAEGDVPLLDLDTLDISIDWGALYSGELVGEIDARGAEVNLIHAESDREKQLGSGVNWPEEIRELFPFRFNRVDVTEARAEFLAPGIDSDDALRLDDIRLALRNLTNVDEENEDAFASLEFAGLFMGSAPVQVSGRIDPNQAVPTFDLDLTLEDADVTEVNPWMEEFLNVDAERGSFSLYAEFAAAEGRFEGYARPLLEDVEIYRRGEEASGPFRRAWEGLVDVARKIFTNRRTDEVATQIPIEGEIENPEAGVMTAILNVLRNAFVAAFTHALEGSVSLRDVDPDAEE